MDYAQGEVVRLTPVSASWLKIAESVKLLRAIKPELAAPIHGAPLPSRVGYRGQLADRPRRRRLPPAR
jgi:hypothetical protein